MNAAQVRPGPLELGMWMSVPPLARFYGVDESTVRRWVAQGRVRWEKRFRRRGVWVWSEDVRRLVAEQRDTPKKRLPRIRAEAKSA